MSRLGVLLLNLGGPDELKDVRPFLYNLFSDPEIIRLPFPWLQKPSSLADFQLDVPQPQRKIISKLAAVLL